MTRREEAAFAALVRRHGARVRAVCRRVLASEHDAEDVAQATFLVLATRASELSWRDSVAGWLCGVAHRLALHARAGTARRVRREQPMASLAGAEHAGRGTLPEGVHPTTDPWPEVAGRDLRRLIHAELNRLPEKYRAPVVLCDLEGLTHSEAAQRLGWPAGSISRRLGRARALLRHRLASHHLPVVLVLAGAALLGLRGGVNRPGLGHSRATVRTAMRTLAASPHGRPAVETLLARAERTEAHVSRTDWLAAAAATATAAETLGQVLPNGEEAAWVSEVGQFRQAALALDRAARAGDEADVLAAARRVSARCVSCHLVFRQ